MTTLEQLFYTLQAKANDSEKRTRYLKEKAVKDATKWIEIYRDKFAGTEEEIIAEATGSYIELLKSTNKIDDSISEIKDRLFDLLEDDAAEFFVSYDLESRCLRTLMAADCFGLDESSAKTFFNKIKFFATFWNGYAKDPNIILEVIQLIHLKTYKISTEKKHIGYYLKVLYNRDILTYLNVKEDLIGFEPNSNEAVFASLVTINRSPQLNSDEILNEYCAEYHPTAEEKLLLVVYNEVAKNYEQEIPPWPRITESYNEEAVNLGLPEKSEDAIKKRIQRLGKNNSADKEKMSRFNDSISFIAGASNNSDRGAIAFNELLCSIFENYSRTDLQAYRFTEAELLLIIKLKKTFTDDALGKHKFEIHRFPEVYYMTYDEYASRFGEIKSTVSETSGSDKKDNQENTFFGEGRANPDYLAVYTHFGLGAQDYQTQEGFIVLFQDRIEDFCEKSKLSEDDVRAVLLMHELGHWITHWPKADSSNWILGYSGKNIKTHETLAQLIAYWLVKDEPRLKTTLEDHMTPMNSDNPYALYKDFTNVDSEIIIEKVTELRTWFILKDDASYEYLRTILSSKDNLSSDIQDMSFHKILQISSLPSYSELSTLDEHLLRNILDMNSFNQLIQLNFTKDDGIAISKGIERFKHPLRLNISNLWECLRQTVVIDLIDSNGLEETFRILFPEKDLPASLSKEGLINKIWRGGYLYGLRKHSDPLDELVTVKDMLYTDPFEDLGLDL